MPGSGHPGPHVQNHQVPGRRHHRAAGSRGRPTVLLGGVVLLVAGLVLTVLGISLTSGSSSGKVKHFQRVAIRARTGVVTFSRAGGYVAYYESTTVRDSTSQSVLLIPVTLTDEAA